MSDKLPLEGRPHLIVKQGADGLLSLGLGPSERYPNGLGILIKVASGFDAKQMELIAGELFAQLGLREHDSPHPSQPKGTRRDHISVIHHCRLKAISDISGLKTKEIIQYVWTQMLCYRRCTSCLLCQALLDSKAGSTVS